VVGASVLGAEECGDEGAVERSESRVEWWRSAAVAGRGETASRQRDGVTHGATTACVAHGADVATGRQHRREVAATAV
jgi:hypothetical protein